jgi:uridine kinase
VGRRSGTERPRLLAGLAERIAAVEGEHPIRVAIDGTDAAGKTTLADELTEPLRNLGRPVIRASVDRFHNPASVRYRQGPDSPEGYYHDSFDYEGLIDALLAPLGPGGSRLYRRATYDYRTDSRVNEPVERAPSDAILLFDGVFLLRPALRDHWDFSIFVHADPAATLERAERRDLELFGTPARVRDRYRRRYLPGQRLYMAECRPRTRASVVIDNTDLDRPFLIPVDRLSVTGRGADDPGVDARRSGGDRR